MGNMGRDELQSESTTQLAFRRNSGNNAFAFICVGKASVNKVILLPKHQLEWKKEEHIIRLLTGILQLGFSA